MIKRTSDVYFFFAVINPIDPKFDGKIDATFPETAQFAIRRKWIV